MLDSIADDKSKPFLFLPSEMPSMSMVTYKQKWQDWGVQGYILDY